MHSVGGSSGYRQHPGSTLQPLQTNKDRTKILEVTGISSDMFQLKGLCHVSSSV